MPSFGEELRRERELRRISLREIAEATKINLRYLDALERNDFEDLPGGIFNRGFVRAYSQFIGVDPDTMVNAYLFEVQAQASKAKGEGGRSTARSRAWMRGTASVAGATAAARQPWLRTPWFWLALGVLGLLLAAGIFWLLQRSSRDEEAPIEPAVRSAEAQSHSHPGPSAAPMTVLTGWRRAA